MYNMMYTCIVPLVVFSTSMTTFPYKGKISMVVDGVSEEAFIAQSAVWANDHIFVGQSVVQIKIM